MRRRLRARWGVFQIDDDIPHFRDRGQRASIDGAGRVSCGCRTLRGNRDPDFYATAHGPAPSSRVEETAALCVDDAAEREHECGNDGSRTRSANTS